MKYTGRCENDFNACGYRRADRQPVSHGGLDRGVVDLGGHSRSARRAVGT
jgi:hypothetical protein